MLCADRVVGGRRRRTDTGSGQNFLAYRKAPEYNDVEYKRKGRWNCILRFPSSLSYAFGAAAMLTRLVKEEHLFSIREDGMTCYSRDKLTDDMYCSIGDWKKRKAEKEAAGQGFEKEETTYGKTELFLRH